MPSLYLLKYSDLPNNHAANLIIFVEKNTYITLLGPTHLLISEKSATYTIKWSYTIIWQVRVAKLLCAI